MMFVLRVAFRSREYESRATPESSLNVEKISISSEMFSWNQKLRNNYCTVE